MNKVQILSPDVIAKIAAGEVIERPASVIKELVENSLDAGATSIEVNLKDAGRELIHIKDNGHGIAHEDLQNIFQRHATSKIRSMDDLETLASMGFRGEALFSIAAVSNIILKSDHLHPRGGGGWEIHVRGGKRISLEPASSYGHGTDIKISELFFNTPARKKFLKSNTSELNQIVATFLPYTLLHPNTRFLLTHAGRALLDLPPTPSATQRMAHALNLDDKYLIETQETFTKDGLTIRLLLGDMNIQRTRKDLQFLFVNGRPVQSRNISFQLNDVYRLILAPGISPAFAVFVELDPANVDVNVHPTKREVKIKDEQRLCSILRHMVEHALMTHGSVKTIQTEDQRQQTNLGISAERIVYGPGQQQSTFNPARFFEPITNNPSTTLRAGEQRTTNNDLDLSAITHHLFAAPTENLQSKFAGARLIGSFMNKYLLFESGTSLLVVDQHAAQERIMFEKFSDQIKRADIEIQPLLTPIVIDLTVQERNVWEEMKDDLKKCGLETTLFDEVTLALHTHPVLIKNPELAVRALLSEDAIARCDHATLARRACKASIRAGDKFRPEEIEHQRQQLLACRDPFTCPHGRPTVIEITDKFLEKEFLR